MDLFIGGILELNNVSIFASGNGSNAINLYNKCRELGVGVTCLICDNPNALILKTANTWGIPVILLEFPENKNLSFNERKDLYSEQLLKVLIENDVKWIFLAGFMRILGSKVLDYFYDQNLKTSRIINIHPSLLPAFPGRNGFKDAFDANVEKSGVTIHFVDEGIDTGPIIAQKTFHRFDDDTFDEFVFRGREVEKFLYPFVIEKIVNNKLSYKNKKFYLED